MPKRKANEPKAINDFELPVGIFLDFDRGYRSGKSVLCHFYGMSCVNLYSQSTWAAIEYSLRVFAQIPDDEPWGRIQWGNNPWDAVEVKDKWEFMERYITPIIEKGRPLISQYDEITQATKDTIQRCESVLQEQEARKARAIALSDTTPNPTKGRPAKIDPNEVYRLRDEGLTQKQIAEELGCHFTMVSKILKKNLNLSDYNQINSSSTNEPTSAHGTDPEYLMARLARDYPEVVEQVKVGEFPSVRAAAVAAGIVRPRLQFTVGPTTTPQAFAGALFERLEPEFLDELYETLRDALGR
jgi:hypothetical protein